MTLGNGKYSLDISKDVPPCPTDHGGVYVSTWWSYTCRWLVEVFSLLFSLSCNPKCMEFPAVDGCFISVPDLLIVLHDHNIYYGSFDCFTWS